ncbi:type II toxin-antitoxin system RelE/ParE family toxin [Nitriliruptoraceae bacterium ZYF776]|nr:type II toxin-antitoxin system RelE/ParE family toxin [Profundirhabdus halotolerans]
MAQVEIARAAVDDLDRLIRTLSLPGDTRARVRTSLEPLGRFPRLGAELGGRWAGFRFLLGPWRWMLLVYVFDEQHERVVVVTIQDARTSDASTDG